MESLYSLHGGNFCPVGCHFFQLILAKLGGARIALLDHSRGLFNQEVSSLAALKFAATAVNQVGQFARFRSGLVLIHNKS